MTTTTETTSTPANDPQIAATILQQLGGRLFIMMTGAKNLLDSGRGLQFKVGENAKGITHVRIDLDPSDTYSLKFYRITKRGLNVEIKAEMEMIYADQLKDFFEQETGLYVTMHARG